MNEDLILAGMPLSADGWVAVCPVGTFTTDKYPKLDLTRKRMTEVVKNFRDKALNRDVRVDDNHHFQEALAWIDELKFGSYTIKGRKLPALLAKPKWTPKGTEVIAEQDYKYLSAAIGPYTDPLTGKRYDNVLKAVSVTNDPVAPVPAIGDPVDVDLSDTPAATVTLSELLGEVVDEYEHGEQAEVPANLRSAAWSIWEATSAFETKVREAIADGLTGDDLKAKIAELAADLPTAVVMAISDGVAEANEGGDSPVGSEKPAPQDDPTKLAVERYLRERGIELTDTGIAVSDTHEDHTNPRGVNEHMSDDTKLAEERDEAVKLAEQRETELADAKAKLAEAHAREVETALAELDYDQPTKDAIKALLTAEGGTITLSEGKSFDNVGEAVLAILKDAKRVHTELAAEPTPEPDEATDERPYTSLRLTDAEKARRAELRKTNS